jgi:AraC-like DNA-binding protein
MDTIEKIHESMDYIKDNLCEALSLEELARKAHFSAFHYHRLFRLASGEPVAEYIRKRRLENAAADLADTEEKLVEIAFKYRFGSQESFIRAFKRQNGISPGEYRRKFGIAVKSGTAKIVRKEQTILRCKDTGVKMAA